MATVYVEVVPSYSRTVWDPAAVAYSKGDRVSYDDGTNEMYVCIGAHTSAASPTPDTDSTNWVLAGSEEYPFQVKSGENNIGANCTATHGEFNLQTNDNGGQRSTDNFCLDAAGAGGTIILGDGVYDVKPISAGWGLRLDGINLTAKNPQKARLSTGYIFYNSNGEFSTLKNIRYGTRSVYGYIGTGYEKWRGCTIEDTTAYGDAGASSSFSFFNTNQKVDLEDCVLKRLTGDCLQVSYGTPATSVMKNCTFLFKNYPGATTFFSATAGSVVFKNLIFYVISSTSSAAWQFGGGGVWTNITWFVGANPGGGTYTLRANNTPLTVNEQNVDPQFVDAASGNTRLRPNSPCIGGNHVSKQAEMEATYPTGKWYDQNAAGGGNGTWGAPYNDIGPAIESFTGNEAVILIKEGTHSFLPGTYNSTQVPTQDLTNDLIRAYSLGIKFIGMGSKTILGTQNFTGYPAWYCYAGGGLSQATYPNISSTTFYFKDLHVSRGPASHRGCFDTPNFDLENVTSSPTAACLAITMPVFGVHGYYHPDNTMKMRGCTFIGTPYTTTQPANAIYFGGGKYDFKNCSFIDDNQFKAGSTPNNLSQEFMSTAQVAPNSVMEDCVFYASTPGYVNQGLVPSGYSSNLTLKNCCLFWTEGDWTASFASSPTVKVNCIVADPQFLQVKFPVTDPRLRPNSPLIGKGA